MILLEILMFSMFGLKYLIVIDVARFEEEIFPQISQKKIQRLSLNDDMNRKKNLLYLISRSRSIITFIVVDSLPAAFCDNLFFSLVDADKIFRVHNLKVLSRDLRNLNTVKIYSVCRRYNHLFYFQDKSTSFEFEYQYSLTSSSVSSS